MSNPLYLDSNVHTRNPTELGGHDIRVRLLRDSDQAQVRELFRLATSTGNDSIFENAMKAHTKSPAAFILYFMTTCGIIMAARSTNPMATFGFSIMTFAGCILFLLYRRHLKNAFGSYLKQTFEGDLADIPKHYKLAAYSSEPNGEKVGLRPIGKSGFWVAELHANGLEPTIVGCLGLDAYSNADETIAELRRLVVSPNHRRKGIANQLMNAAIAHGKSHGIRSLFLTTTSYQPAAIKMYQNLGWELEAIIERSILLEKVRVHKFRLGL